MYSSGGAFSLEAFIELARQTLDALACAHQANLVHRDIKPSNIMLVDLPSGLFQAKVLDFGLAKFLNTDAPSPQTVTIDGSIRGSVHYISPEQLNHEAVDARSDLYSLGCSLYLALTSIEPFSGETVAQIIAAHLTHRVLPVSEVLPSAPPAISEWLMKLMGRKPVDRFQTAIEAMDALEMAAMKSGVSSATRGIRVDRRSAVVKNAENKSHRILWTAAAAAAVVCAGLAAVFVFPGKKSAEPAASQIQAQALPVVPAAPATSAVKENIASAPVAPVVPIEAAPAPVPSPAPVVSTAKAPTPPPAAAEVIMQVVGSNTIGARLMPRLIEAFLERMKMTGLSKEQIKAEETAIQFLSPLGDGHKAIAVKAHGSSTAFKELLAGSCDIGMSSRPIKDEELQNLAGLGDMRTSACEHVVGLDGLAVIVNQSNPVSQLTVQQVAALFSGEIRDWSEIGGTPGPVTLYARDDKSGTFDSFKSLVLDKKPLHPDARRFEDSGALSDGVAADPSAIGFIGLPYVRSTKALALSDNGTTPMLPSPFTVSTEDYILSRRLYLYTPAVPKNAWTTNFVEFVLSDEGQDIVEKAGFIAQRIGLESIASSPEMSESYRSLIEHGAGRLSITFRFQPNQKELDAKAVRDSTVC